MITATLDQIAQLILGVAIYVWIGDRRSTGLESSRNPGHKALTGDHGVIVENICPQAGDRLQ